MLRCAVMVALTLGLVACEGDESMDTLDRDGAVDSVDAATDAADAEPDATEPDAEPDEPDAEPWTPTVEPCPAAANGIGQDCVVPGFEDRPYIAVVPDQTTPDTPHPVVVLFHGGTGNAQAGMRVTCPPNANGQPDLNSAGCLHRLTDFVGAVAVFVNGSLVPGSQAQRTFDAGGGVDGYQCVGGYWCRQGVDEEAYVTAVLAHLDGWVNVDQGAVFATGLSNGAAMSHRLACTMSDRFAAIASVGGGNQYETAAPCEPAQPVAILHIHGDADRCWTYEETRTTCAPGDFDAKVGAEDSTRSWAARNDCAPEPTETVEPDADGDGETTVAVEWRDCDADVTLLRVEGMGHTWPDGFQYGPVETIGPVRRDWGNARIWAWFDAHRR